LTTLNLIWLIFQIIFIISPIWAYQGCPPSNLQCRVFPSMVASVFFGTNHRKQYTVCAHECYYSLFTCQSRSLCSFISKSLSTVGQGRWMHPGSLPKNPFCSTPIVTVLM
jgi:hypothetical protein